MSHFFSYICRFSHQEYAPSPFFAAVLRVFVTRSLVLLFALLLWLATTRPHPTQAAHGPLDPSPGGSPYSTLHTDPEHESPASPRSPISDPRLLLPDLRTLPPFDLKIVALPDGRRELRLSNTIWNSGAGALELEGIHDRRALQTQVIQHVDAQVGSRLAYPVGEFIFHPTHEHWHFEQFSIYQLWALTPRGELGSLASSSDKVSYCLIDTDIIEPDNPAYQPRRNYYGCGRAFQGLSAGWGDTYKSHLDGQSIRLSGVKDGFYALVSTANPDGILLEADTSNNTAVLYLEIRGESLALVTPSENADQACPTLNRC